MTHSPDTETDLYNMKLDINYKETLTEEVDIVFIAFISLLNNFIVYFMENMNNKNDIIIRKGIHMLGHIFIHLYSHTKNIELVIYYCKSSIIYFVEYITQITDKDDNMFFNLSLKDAIIYVYTKSIYTLDENKRQKTSFNNNEKTLLTDIHDSILVYSNIMENISSSKQLKEMHNDEREIYLNGVVKQFTTYIENNRSLCKIKMTSRVKNELTRIESVVQKNDFSNLDTIFIF